MDNGMRPRTAEEREAGFREWCRDQEGQEPSYINQMTAILNCRRASSSVIAELFPGSTSAFECDSVKTVKDAYELALTRPENKANHNQISSAINKYAQYLEWVESGSAEVAEPALLKKPLFDAAWIQAYEAIASALLAYKDDHRPLCDIVERILNEEYDDMDPLTFFSMFNGKRRNYVQRANAVSTIIDSLEIEVEKPQSFDGIPTTNPQRWRFWGGGELAIPHNWEVFEAALNYADYPSVEAKGNLIRCFDVVRAQRNVGDASLTMALFWSRPREYLPLDNNTKAYLRNRYGITVRTPVSGEKYLDLLDRVRGKTKDTFADISYSAWQNSGWIPARSEYDPQVDVATWLDLLSDSSIGTPNALTALKCLGERPNGATCIELATFYGRNDAFYNSNISTLGEKVANRIGLPPREEEGGKWWPVVCLGNYVGKRRQGTFEWKLRREVLEAIGQMDLSNIEVRQADSFKAPVFDEDSFRTLTTMYKMDFHRFRGHDAEGGDRETYKWDDLLAYRRHWNLDADDLKMHIEDALKPSAKGQGALLDSRYERPLETLLTLCDFDKEAVRSAFRVLYNPDSTLPIAYSGFIGAVDELMARYNEESGNAVDEHHQSPKAASVYLFFEMPERYHYYKRAVADGLAECIGAELPNGPLEAFYAYEALCDALMPLVDGDRELIDISDSILTEEQRSVDPAHHLLLQDIAYYAARYMKDWHPDWKTFFGLDSLVKERGTTMPNQKLPNNIILCGPPGTGKTFYVSAFAWLIAHDKQPTLANVKSLTDDELRQAKQWYDDQVDDVKTGQVAFTTFHQSYGYEEFIEGIRPVVNRDDSGEDGGSSSLIYKYEDGIFKAFCKRAARPVAIETVKDFGFNNSPTVWKVSLGGTGDNPVRSECLANGHIRIGWDDYGPEVTEETDFSIHGGKSILDAFFGKMRKGDIVLSCYSQNTIDAIGVVTGDPEWHDEYGQYKRLRNVKWVAKGFVYDVVSRFELPVMTLSTIYKMALYEDEVLTILDEMGRAGNGDDESREKDYIFVIDEINRGNISKVFGELITLIEVSKRKGMREQQVATLPYTKQPFSIPSNVHIIGTMNTADRSIALMDTALRRRFEFIEVMPDPDLLRDVQIGELNIGEMLRVMNERIELLHDREHTIGHAFFLPLKKSSTVGRLRDIFRNQIMPLLQEYFFDDYEKIRLVLGAAADDFVSLKKVDDVFWRGSDYPSHLQSYEIKDTPTDLAAYVRICQIERGA